MTPPAPTSFPANAAGLAQASASERRRRSRTLIALVSSLGVHAALVEIALNARRPSAERPRAASPLIEVSLVPGLRLRPTPATAQSASAAPPSPRSAARRRPPRPVGIVRDPSDADAPPGLGALSASDVAGAARPGSGGLQCDMAGRLQTALNKDTLVQSALAGQPGRALLIWNGDWVQTRGESGKGLAAVREAVMWEIAFAPEACRSQAVHGLVLIPQQDAGRASLAMGSAAWRWSDLLTSHSSAASER